MHLLIIASPAQRQALTKDGIREGTSVTWIESIDELSLHGESDAVIDLEFEHSTERLDALQRFLPRPVIINSVIHTLEQTHSDFIRINGWEGFLDATLVEAAAQAPHQQQAEAILDRFHKKLEWVPDVPGFITSRVVSMIINEAFLALEEGVSTEEEIDTAMKLGTNYPYGPFEWATKIGVHRVYALLFQLHKTNERYQPAPLLSTLEESC